MLRVIIRTLPFKKAPWLNKDNELSRMVKLYSTKESGSKKESGDKQDKSKICPPKPKKKSSTGTLVTLGAIALVSGATLAYAKYDNDFRDQLVCILPFTDRMIAVMFGEEKIQISNPFQSIIDKLTQDREKDVSESIKVEKSKKEYTPPTPLLPIIEKEQKPPLDCYTEIRLEKKEEGEDEPDVVIAGKPKPERKKDANKYLKELEADICQAATEAVNAYQEAVYLQKVYNRDIEEIAETNISKIPPEKWADIRQTTRKKNETIKQAEERASAAIKDFKKLKDEVQSPEFEADDTTREIVINNIARVEEDIDDAKKELERVVRAGSVREKFWKKVEKSRKMFQDELEALFPDVDINQKKLRLNPEDLDLFLLHVYSTVLFYQRELAKIESIGQEKKNAALEDIKKGKGGPFNAVQVCEMLEQEKRRLSLCFQQQCLLLRKQLEDEMKDRMMRQSQAFADHLDDALRTREMEVMRELSRKFDEELEAERCKFKLQMAAMVGRLKGLDAAVKLKRENEGNARDAQVLWSACQALIRTLRAGCPGVPWKDQLKPLESELHAVKLAASGDPVVEAVLASVPEEAISRGVFPEDALRERFLAVEKVARNVALVPDGGAALPVHFLSYLQGLFLLKAASPIPQSELNDEETDFSKLNTNEILQRARYWIDRGNFEQTLKYMNLLRGAPRCVARQWMNETRIYLETQQAADTLMAHAASSGLLYL